MFHFEHIDTKEKRQKNGILSTNIQKPMLILIHWNRGLEIVIDSSNNTVSMINIILKMDYLVIYDDFFFLYIERLWCIDALWKLMIKSLSCFSRLYYLLLLMWRPMLATAMTKSWFFLWIWYATKEKLVLFSAVVKILTWLAARLTWIEKQHNLFFCVLGFFLLLSRDAWSKRRHVFVRAQDYSYKFRLINFLCTQKKFRN